ncbi:unnamed protein product [Rhizopus stolonifer]
MFNCYKLNMSKSALFFLLFSLMGFILFDLSNVFYSFLFFTFDYCLRCTLVFHSKIKNHAELTIDLKTQNVPHRQRQNSVISCSPLSPSSLCSLDSNRSRVEEMVFLFETAHHQHRRYSVDSYHYDLKRTFIRERKFEYLPTVSEWKKREKHISSLPPPVHLSASTST